MKNFNELREIISEDYFTVQYYNGNGSVVDDKFKNFKSKAEADKYAKKGNKIDSVGGEYKTFKVKGRMESVELDEYGLAKGRGFPGIKADPKKKKNKRVLGQNKNIAYNYDKDKRKRKESVEIESVELEEKVSLSKKGNYEVSADGKSSVGIRIGLRFKGKLIVPGTKQKGLFVMGFDKKDGKHKLPPGATIVKDSGKYLHIGFKKVNDIIAYAMLENITDELTHKGKKMKTFKELMMDINEKLSPDQKKKKEKYLQKDGGRVSGGHSGSSEYKKADKDGYNNDIKGTSKKHNRRDGGLHRNARGTKKSDDNKGWDYNNSKETQRLKSTDHEDTFAKYSADKLKDMIKKSKDKGDTKRTGQLIRALRNKK